MSAQYYASFLIHDERNSGVTKYSGVVELTNHPDLALGNRELIRMLAQNLEVSSEDVELLQWGPIH